MPTAVDAWFVRESLLDDADVAVRLEGLLSDEEAMRRDRMAFDSGRRQQLLARGLQRLVLSKYAPEFAPRDWQFVQGAAGRPELAPPFDATGLYFNVAHTAGMVALAVGRVPFIGIDVEPLDRRVPLHVAPRYFSESEVAALQALPPEQQPRRFLRLWTLKEAYLKAVGEGLAGGLDSMTFTFDEGGGIGFEHGGDPEADRWVFREFDPGGFLLALAYKDSAAGAAADVHWREWRSATWSGQEQGPET
jgi:4'-phosphopantetheinyl transferase